MTTFNIAIPHFKSLLNLKASFFVNTPDPLQSADSVKSTQVYILTSTQFRLSSYTHAERENLDTLESSSELIITIISSIAQEESKNLSANVSWGFTKRFSQGVVHMPTTYFLGYDRDEEDNIVINEAEAEVVRRIFRELLEGKGATLIAKGLMEDGILTARGNPTWTNDSVLKLLRNERYTGNAICQKTVTLDFLSHKRTKNNNHKPQYLVRNHHPAIISEETYNDVQKELARRYLMQHDPDLKYATQYSGKAPFSNMLFCGDCGRPVTRRRLTSKRNRAYFHFTAWQCRVASQRSKEDIECHSKYVWEEALEDGFVRLLYEMKGEIPKIIEDANKAIEIVSLTEEEVSRLKELEEKIEVVADQISELASRSSGRSNPVYEANLRHLVYEQEILMMEHESLSKNKDESLYLQRHLDELIEILDDLESDDFNAEIFKKIVERGTLYEDYRVEFMFKCGIMRNTSAARRTEEEKQAEIAMRDKTRLFRHKYLLEKASV